MIGQTVSHYRILEELGGGGMGVVYKALDVRLNRHVALKFLSPELTRDLEANQRFRQEAQAASALDHPNICTIHEIDETPSGELFLAMGYYEGSTLRARIANGPLAMMEALDVAVQTAQGLARAHQSSIVHRDVKPANLILTADGTVKILDFGLAKLVGHSEVTRTGAILGTIAYMSPEQARGDALDARTDVWSLGVVLYEMLTGKRPFAGRDDVATLSSILNATPEPIANVRADVPVELRRIVEKALERSPQGRYPSATEMLADLAACRAGMSAVTPPARARGVFRRPVVVAVVAAAVVAAAIPIGSSMRRSAQERRARLELMPEIARLSEAGHTQAAYALVREAERHLPGDPALTSLRNQVSLAVSLETQPEGADVYAQPYGSTDGQWEHLGRSPIKELRLARGDFRIRVEKPGFDTRMLAAKNPGPLFNNFGGLRGGVRLIPPQPIQLDPAGSQPGMVPVFGGAFPVGLTGFNSELRVAIPPFRIDRREITNREFKAWLDGGGYTNATAWAGLPFEDHPGQSWEVAVRAFVDSTGKPGPSPWELGDFPAGQAEYPVGGVSWYEAAAYCRAAGKTLPSIVHWARAALSPIEIGSSLAQAIIPVSNFGKKGPAAVGTFKGLGPYGTDDMAGNVREWVWNETADRRRWILGGSWNDSDYLFTVPNSLPPSDRSAANGFRCARYEDPSAIPANLLARFDTYTRDHRTSKPVSDEVFDVFRRQYARIVAPPNVRVDPAETSNNPWVRETMTFDAGYEPGRISAQIFLPRDTPPPYQVVIYFPGVGPFIGLGSSRGNMPAVPDYVVRSGRAVVVPIFKGSYERWDNFINLEGADYLRTFRARMGHWRQDLGQTIDALAERKTFDLGSIAYYGVSFGASTAFPVIALENRIKTAILAPAGYTYRELPPEADAVNYAPRVTIPVLMLGGRHDYIFPLETSQKPLFDHLGTPPAHKRHVVMEAGHTLPRNEVIREVLAWLDRYLGPVAAAKTGR